MERIDARGLACPEPVVLTKKALDRGAERVEVLVDDVVARDNIKRLAGNNGYDFAVATQGNDLVLTLTRQDACARAVEDYSAEATTLVVDSETLGRGDEELGQLLRRVFIHTLTEADKKPARVMFINSGVKLVCEGSPVLEDLQALAKSGTQIFACGTCLDYYELKNKVAVGSISNMYDFVDAVLSGARMVTV